MALKGRPFKQTVEYFPHFVSASDTSQTLFILETEFGLQGYAFFFKLLELLGQTPGHAYDFSPFGRWKYLVARSKVDENKVKAMLNLLAEDGAIDKELYNHQVIWSDRFVDHLKSALYVRRKDEAAPVKPSFPPHPLNNQSKVKESKGKENTHKIPPDDLMSTTNQLNQLNVDNNNIQTDLSSTINQKKAPQSSEKEEGNGGHGPAAAPPSNGKIKWADDVFMSQVEHDKLVAKFGQGGTQARIEKLSFYIGSKGLQKKYKDHYKTILNWEAKDHEQPHQPGFKGKHFVAPIQGIEGLGEMSDDEE